MTTHENRPGVFVPRPAGHPRPYRPDPEDPMNNPQRYRHRTEVVDAIQWTGHNADALRAFAGPAFDEIDLDDRIEDPDQTAAIREAEHGTWRGLKPGDWVVRLDEGLYEFSAADFTKSYEPVPAGLVAVPPTTTDRDRIAAALYERERPPRDPHWPDVYASDREVFEAMADAVLAVLPPPADRAAVLREAEAKAREVVARLWDGGTTQTALDRAGGARAVEFEIGQLAAQADPSRLADEAQQQSETPREWCKCRSCWGWFVEEHPGEDLDELGRDLSWWSGLPEHRDAPAGVQTDETRQDGAQR